MSAAQHTPGPWSVDPIDDLDAHILGKPNGFCADIIADVKSFDLDEGQANARLIAAAPDLLEALKGAVDAADAFEAGVPLSTSFEDWLASARAAIAKATGAA